MDTQTEGGVPMGDSEKQGSGSEQSRERQYDERFKQLCNHSEVVRDLIIVAFPHLKDKLDFSTLQKLSSEFVGPNLSRRLSQRRADGVWRVNLRDRDDYKIVLIEHQARKDSTMSIRVMNYTGLMYANLSEQNPPGMPRGRLPEALPIVLFSGLEPWDAKEDVADMIGLEEETPAPGERPSHWPQMKYRLVDLYRHPVGDAPWENLVLAFCALAQAAVRKEDAGPLLKGVAKRLQSIGKENLAGVFYACVKETVMTDHWDGSDMSALERVEAIAVEAQRPVPIWVQEWRAEGGAEVREELLDTVRKRILEEVSSKFDPETAKKLEARLKPISDLDLLAKIPWRINGMTGPELLAWIDART